jgi:hypothetical protein
MKRLQNFINRNNTHCKPVKLGNGLYLFLSVVLVLLGLVMYTIQQHAQKEIGIRKILGATVTNIISIL